MTTISENFKSLGLTEKEELIFYSLIQRGTSSVKELADMLSLKRPTIYLHLESLKQQGLIVENVNDKKKTFQAVNMKTINKIIDHKIQSLRKLKTEIPKIIEKAEKQAMHKPLKGFTVYQGITGAHVLADDVARFDGPVYYFGSLQETEKYFDQIWYEKFYNRLRRKKMNEDYMISSWSSQMTVKLFYEESDVFNKRRFLPSNILPKGCFVFYGNKLVIMYYYPEITAIVLEDKMMVQMFKQAYAALWENLENKNIPPNPNK